MAEYYVPAQDSETEFTEKRSRFIGHLWRVESEEEAREKIAQGGSLGQISEQCGFGDYSTFSRAYKRQFGISPNAGKPATLAQDEILD